MSPSRLDTLFEKLVTGGAEDKTSIIKLIDRAMGFHFDLKNAEWRKHAEEVKRARQLSKSILDWFSDDWTDDEDNHKDEDKDRGKGKGKDKGKGKGKDDDKEEDNDKDKDNDRDSDRDSDKDLDNDEHNDEDNEDEITDFEDEDDEAAADSPSGSDYCQTIPNFVAL